MKTRFRYDGDDWTTEGEKITSPESLDIIRSVLEKEGPIIVQHWFYRGASAPEYTVFDEFEDFIQYLNEDAYAGDAIDIWSFWRICKPESRLTKGKCPDENDLIPRGGAY